MIGIIASRMAAQPIFIIAPPASGAEVLAESLARASGATLARGAGGSFLEDLDELDPAQRDWSSHALSAEDAALLKDTAGAALAQSAAGGPADARPIASGMRLALRVPFLAAAFPESTFVLIVRDARDSLPRMLEAWRSGSAISCPELPDWGGPAWSLPLIPGWRELRGLPLEAVVVEQWREIVEQALNALEQLPPERWAVCSLEALLEDPRRELRRLCSALELRYDQALLDPPEAARRNQHPAEPPTPEFERELPRIAATEERLRELIAIPARPAAAPDPEASPFRSVSTGSFGRLLGQLGTSLLISTYQAGRLVAARPTSGGQLNTHFRQFDKPMGLAVAGGRFALGTRTEVIDFRNMPEVAPKVDPPGTHDACYLPRNRHVTGDILIHEMAYAGGELWAVATAFSCLATFDADHSFIPRWKPPFISQLATGDRCHLNGMAVVEDRVAFVTALGQSDEPGGWRENKASGGCLISVDSSEVVVSGLSMPHSPRWHDGRMWFLESGRGSLATIDLDTGAVETVAELPGFTRGLEFVGDLAFIGLSQIRESSTFGDLPLTARLQERVAGVWIVNVRSGNEIGFLRFEDIVQEVFDLAFLPGVRYPEIAEPASTAVMSSFQLP